MAGYRFLRIETVLENYAFLVNMYNTHSGYRTSIFGKRNCAYYIRILRYLQLDNQTQQTGLP